jgi:hypothetical protein
MTRGARIGRRLQGRNHFWKQMGSFAVVEALISAAIVLLALSGCGSGAVSGSVIEKGQRTPVQGAIVTLGNRQEITGPDGSFLFEDVASGQLQMSVTAKGYQDVSQEVAISGHVTQTIVQVTRNAHPSVQIIAPAPGDKVRGGSTVRVAAVASGFASRARLRLVVDGSAIGPARSGRTCSFLWHTPTSSRDCVIRVVASTSDGVVVRSVDTRVKVDYAAPVSTSGGQSTAEAAGSHWWGAFYYASKSLSEAEGQADRGTSAGYSTYVLNTLDYANLGKPGEKWWVVCAGKYGTYADAQAAAAMLRADGFSGAYAKEVY